MRPCVRCNGAPVYKKERGTYYDQPSYLYRHTHGAHGGMYWAFGYTRHSKAAEVCDPKNSANAKDFAGVFFDTANAADCGAAGPDAPGCVRAWRECTAHCYAYPAAEGLWYAGVNPALKVVASAAGVGGGH